MRKRKMLAAMFALVLVGAAAPSAGAATVEEESEAAGRFVRWRNTDGTLNCYPGCEPYKPCC